MKRKGFTLVELLAVIAILAILVIIALPNVMGMFNTAKENSFKTEIKEIYKTAQNQWMQDSMFKNDERVYSRCSGCTGKSLDLSGRSELSYYIKVNKAGNIVEYYATDGTFQYSFNNSAGLKVENINNIQKIADLNDDQKITITDRGVSNRPVVIKEFCVTSSLSTTTTSFRYIPYEDGMTFGEFFDSDYHRQSELYLSIFEPWRFYLKDYYSCTGSTCNQYGYGDEPGDEYFDKYNLQNSVILDKDIGCYFDNGGLS